MEEVEPAGPPKGLYCRLCCSTDDSNNFRNMFSVSIATQSLAKIILDFAKVKIMESDSFSNLICLICFAKLSLTEDFKTQIYKTNLKLKNQNESNCHDKGLVIDEELLNKNVKIKVEPFDPISSESTPNKDNELKQEPPDEVDPSEPVEIIERQPRPKRKKIRKKVAITCIVCHKILRSREGFKAHMIQHTGLYKYYCSFCNRGCAQKSILHAHEAKHKEHRAYQCELCGKGFKYQTSLRKHKFVHTDVKAVNCEICGKAFKTKYHLSDHKRTHKT